MSEDTQLTIEQATDWLRGYGQAWERGDVEAIGSLFAEDAVYVETPFAAPMVGRAAIRDYWRDGARDGQRDVRFDFTVWTVDGWTCCCHWRARFTRAASGEAVELDGVFRLIFARDGADRLVCRELREWWHRR